MKLKDVFKKVRHYADPRTHIKAVRSAYSHTAASVSRAHAFQRRVVSRDNIKNIGRNIAVIETKFMPYVTGAFAFVVSLLFTPFAGAGVTAVGAGAARYQGATAGRAKGKSGNEARQEGRKRRDQTIQLGALGTTAGALTSVAVAALSTAPQAAGAGVGIGTNEAALLGGIGTDEAAVAAAAAAGDLPGAVVAAELSGAAASNALGGAAAGGGILGSLWSGVKDVAGYALQIVPTVMKFLPTKTAKGGDAGGVMSGDGAGAEGTGDVGADGGGYFDDISGLPLWVKLAGGGVGAGLLYMAFRKKGKVAA